MTDYYRKIYVADFDEEKLIDRVNEIIKKISPGNLTDIQFNPTIQGEVSYKLKNPSGAYDNVEEETRTDYIIRYTCLITELVEEKTSLFRKKE